MAKKKADPAHIETDKLLEQLEKRIAKEYKQAEEEVQAKLDDYLRRFELKDKKWQEWVENGTKTRQEYKQWRIGQIAVGKRWELMKQTLAEDFHNANKIARSIIDGYKPEVYAINHNYATYEIEHGTKLDTSYTLYDRQTVEKILKDNPDLLPPPGKKVSQRIAEGKDIRWNRQQIQSVATQAILQGESIPNIADRLARRVGDNNHKAAIRNARTMITGAENAGRVDGYKRAEDMGIEMQQQWVATLDSRTRHSHRMMDGETVDVGEEFSNGCKYPGDPDGEPAEIYNCRCTLIASLKGYERDLSDLSLRRNEKLGDMSYSQWKKAKAESNPITLPEEKAESIRQSYINEYRRK